MSLSAGRGLGRGRRVGFLYTSSNEDSEEKI
jgi:hypothetical protein